jgi:hypothetical protein
VLLGTASSLATTQESRPAESSAASSIQAGHWVELRGRLVPATGGQRSLFEVDEIEVLEPQKYETLIATIAAAASDGSTFELLSLAAVTDAQTDWGDVPRASLNGRRVKAEGRWRQDRFEVRELSLRAAGRERIVGRVDETQASGPDTLLYVLQFDALVKAETAVKHATPLASIARDEPRPRAATADRDEDDLGAGHPLGADWSLATQLGVESTWREDHDLDASQQKDRQDQDFSGRARLSWSPSTKLWGQDLAAVIEGRYSGRFRSEEGKSDDWSDSLAFGEAYVRWEQALGVPLTVLAGRQDFDDPREWIYDQNLDALRVIYASRRARLELSASTSFGIDDSNSERDEDTANYIAYLSNTDPTRHLALWIVDRRDSSAAQDSPIWFGARALGKWIPRNKSWAEFAVRRGYRDLTDLEGFGFDLGTTWSPRATDPVSFTAGYAFGSGDPDPLDGTDESFTQTGFNDNNGKWSGVTSFLYYGELVDPQLSNLAIATLGVAADLPAKSSIDLVWHGYRQDVAQALDSFGKLRAPTLGDSRDIGWEIDLVYGTQHWKNLDIEIVLGWFEPGAAFDDEDPAWLARAQLRWRW